jgi:hypothetical protein
VGGELGGHIYGPGVYSSDTGYFHVGGTLTLDAGGNPDAVFVFKAATALNTQPCGPYSCSQVSLVNGAKADNIFWQVGCASLATNADFYGTILSSGFILVDTSVTVHGRLLTQGDVNLNRDNLVVVPEPSGTFVLFAGLSGLVIGIRRIRRHLRNPAH